MDERIINGLAEFVKHEVIPKITDNGTKIVIGTFISMAKRDPSMLPILDHLNGSWIDAMCDSVREYGNVTITIPAIPLISPDVKRLTFDANDIERLKNYM